MPAGYTPVFKILKDGNDITNRFNDRTTSIQVQLKGGGGDSDTCSITIDDRDWKIAAVEVEANIEIYLGYKEIGYAQMGLFEVSTVDYEINPRQIKITGTSVSFSSALKAPVNLSHENKTLGQIVNGIAGSGGIEAYISPELAEQQIPFVNQTTSPLHLLHELERRFGALAKVENRKLIFVQRDEGETAGGIEMPVLVLRPGNLSGGFVRHTQRGDYSSAKVGWFDEDHVKRYAEETNHGAPTGEDGTAKAPAFLSGKIARTEGEAKAMARSQLAALRRSMGEANLTLSKGDPLVRDQMRVLIADMRDKINGSYITDTVTHTYVKDQGIVTEILAKPPGDGADYTSLNDGDFYKLGTGGVVGDAGPQLPDPSQGPIGGTPSPAPTEDAPPVMVPDEPVNV